MLLYNGAIFTIRPEFSSFNTDILFYLSTHESSCKGLPQLNDKVITVGFVARWLILLVGADNVYEFIQPFQPRVENVHYTEHVHMRTVNDNPLLSYIVVDSTIKEEIGRQFVWQAHDI